MTNQGISYIEDVNRHWIGVFLESSGSAITAASASIAVELIDGSGGSVVKKTISMIKLNTDGFFKFNISSFASSLNLYSVYSYCLSSGGTSIDSTLGRFQVVSKVRGRDVLTKIDNLKRDFDNSYKEILTEIKRSNDGRQIQSYNTRGDEHLSGNRGREPIRNSARDYESSIRPGR